MVSTFKEFQGVHKRECKQTQLFFVAMSDYRSVEIIQYYEEKWKREPKHIYLGRVDSGHQGVFFPIFNFTIIKFEMSMEKYLGYTMQDFSFFPKEYTIGYYLNLCVIENWY